MKFLSTVLLGVARYVPVGYWRIIRFAAIRDPALWDYPIDLKCCPDTPLRADLRETVYTGIFRSGAIPHQVGFDRICQRLLRNGDIVFDVGANIGYTSILFRSIVGQNGLVVSFEPVPRSFELLQRACQGMENVKCLNIAVSNSPGELRMFVSNMLDRASTTEIQGGECVSVRADTIDSMIGEYGVPQFVKIDVEGFEPTVLDGMKKVLGCEGAPIIIYEALDDASRSESRSRIEKHTAMNYTFFRIDEKGALISYESPCGSSDYIALPPWAMSRLQ